MPPVLLVIDEDSTTREVVTAQLGGRYGGDYRVDRAGGPAEAARVLTDLAQAGDEVALVLTPLTFADGPGHHLLEQIRELHPHAKIGLMVPWDGLADASTSQAIVDAIALGRIDYYVPLPAGWPDEVFHSTISTFLLEWATEQRKVPHTVRIIGEEWSGRARELRETFQNCALPHTFSLIGSDEGRRLLETLPAPLRLPAMILPDGSMLGDPSNAEIAAAAGAPTDFDEQEFDVVIVGAGPAGLSAAVYASSEGLRTLVVDEGGIGGQARSSSAIRNYLGFPRGVSGSRLAEQAYEQAKVFGAAFVFMHRATAITRSGEQLTVALAGDRSVNASAVILGTGAAYTRLEIPSLEALNGAGVFYGGPASVAHALSGTDVFVAGGGNSAGQAVLHLSRYARRATLVVRSSGLEAGMSRYLIHEIEATPNIDVCTGTTVVGGGGDTRLRELVLRDRSSGVERTVPAAALFVMIGARPHTEWLPSAIVRDDHGFLRTGDAVADTGHWPLERPPLALETSMPGVLAAGDVRHGSVKRVASAVGEGSIAVSLVHSILAAQPQRAS